MKTYILIEVAGVFSCLHLWEGKFNEGIIDDYKRGVRANGGRVIAVIRPKAK